MTLESTNLPIEKWYAIKRMPKAHEFLIDLDKELNYKFENVMYHLQSNPRPPNHQEVELIGLPLISINVDDRFNLLYQVDDIEKKIYIIMVNRFMEIYPIGLGESKTKYQIEESERLNSLIDELKGIPHGGTGKNYEECIFEIFKIFFLDQLSHPKRESRTIAGTERIDIIFLNMTTHKFWEMISRQHQATNIVFECKNVRSLDLDHVNQLSGYLGKPHGNFGVIVTRRKPGERIELKAIAAYNRDQKIIIFVDDEDIFKMAELRMKGKDPTTILEKKYVNHLRLIQ